MNLTQIKTALNSENYDFLRNNKNLGDNIMILTLGGSHAYGTNIETSDLDIRGCACDNSYNILTNRTFEHVVDNKTDTTIYAFNKLITLLKGSNPNVIEMLGNKPEHYLYLNDYGRELIANADMFLSKKAINAFGGYAHQQLRRLENKANRIAEREQQEKHILETIEYASHDFKTKFPNIPEHIWNLYVADSDNPDYDSEIFINIDLKHCSLRDYVGIIAELQSIVKSYDKIGKRNENAISHDKLGKHMMHLIRLYAMCLDILENEKIITYREKEHDLLMNIRNNKYLDENKQPIPEFYELVNDYKKRLDYAKANTSLPDEPDYDKINDFVASVNRRILNA